MKKSLLALLFLFCQSFPALASPPPIPPGPPGIAANGGTGNNITLNGTTNITGSASNAVTQPPVDNTVRIATDQFVQSLFAVTRSTVYLSGVAGGTLSFASVGTGAAFSFTATGGVITSINSVFAGGSGYKVGDVLYIPRGNYDNYIMVTGVSGTAITSVQILNGGTGNTSGLDVSAMAAIEAPIIYNVSGTLTSNLTVIASNGAVLGYSGIFLLINNTTGNYTESVCISNGSDACNGNGSVNIPQGSGNSCATLTYTDGSTPWLLAPTECGAAQFATVNLGSSVSAANWSTTSPMFNVPASTLTDTTGSGTIAMRGAETINNCTFAASSSETITNAYCLYVGSPTAGGNTSLTNAYSILATSGIYASSYVGGNINVNGSILPGTGIYRPASNTLGISSAGTAAGVIDANQNWRIGGAGTPTISSGACGTGTNGTIASNGNNQGFEVIIGSAATTTCTITFATSGFVTAPREAQLTPANSTAAAQGTTLAYVSSLGTTTMVITGSALANANYYVQVQ